MAERGPHMSMLCPVTGIHVEQEGGSIRNLEKALIKKRATYIEKIMVVQKKDIDKVREEEMNEDYLRKE